MPQPPSGLSEVIEMSRLFQWLLLGLVTIVAWLQWQLQELND